MNLSPTAKVVLGMIALGERTGYDIKRTVEHSTAFFWGASYGQIYPELERLERAGLVKGKAQTGGRGRREYTVTARGRRALTEWLSADAPLAFNTRDEGLLKQFFGDLVPLEVQLENVRRVIAQNESGLAFFRTIVAEGSTADVLEYGIDFLEWNIQWWRGFEGRLKRRARAPRRSDSSAQDRP
jgi:DNA-binding PadR family transcriptional regulator